MTIETRIYIIDWPHLNWEEALGFLKKENILLPNEDQHGYPYYVAGALGKIMGKYLLSLGWKFEVEDVEIRQQLAR